MTPSLTARLERMRDEIAETYVYASGDVGGKNTANEFIPLVVELAEELYAVIDGEGGDPAKSPALAALDAKLGGED